MHNGADMKCAANWLRARRHVQRLAEAVLGDVANRFLYRGKFYGEGMPGQYISALLGSPEGCEAVVWLIERLDADETLDAVIVDGGGHEPDGASRPVLQLLNRRLVHRWPDGNWQRVLPFSLVWMRRKRFSD